MWCRAVSLILLAAGQPAWAQIPPDGGTACVDVQIGTDRSYACLNESLQRIVAASQRKPPLGTPSSGSPVSALGLFNETATRERMGNAFGHAALPQRVAQPVALSPLFPVTGH